MNVTRSVRLFCAAAALALLATPAFAQLKHHWDFNTPGAVIDGVGGANGTLLGNTSVSGGSLIMPGGTSDWVTFDPNIIGLQNLTAFSVEFWATPDPAMTGYHSVWAFGEDYLNNMGNPTGAANHFVIIQTHRDNGDASGAAISLMTSPAPYNFEDNAMGAELNDNAQHHYVATYDENAGINWYIDNVLQGSLPEYAAVDDLQDQNDDFSDLVPGWARIGKGYGWDPTWMGSINELNIYTGVMSPEQVATNFQTGPSQVPEPATLVVALLGICGLGVARRRR